MGSHLGSGQNTVAIADRNKYRSVFLTNPVELFVESTALNLTQANMLAREGLSAQVFDEFHQIFVLCGTCNGLMKGKIRDNKLCIARTATFHGCRCDFELLNVTLGSALRGHRSSLHFHRKSQFENRKDVVQDPLSDTIGHKKLLGHGDDESAGAASRFNEATCAKLGHSLPDNRPTDPCRGTEFGCGRQAVTHIEPTGKEFAFEHRAQGGDQVRPWSDGTKLQVRWLFATWHRFWVTPYHT